MKNNTTNIRRLGVIFTCSLTILTACSSPKDANNRNFEKAITDWQASSDRNGRNCQRMTVMDNRAVEVPTAMINDAKLIGFRKLKDYGYVKFTATTGNFPISNMTKIEITDKYLKDFGDPENSFMRVCPSRFVFKKIINFTEPADMMGVKMSYVDAEVEQEVTADWAKDKALTDLIGFTPPEKTAKKTYTMVLKDSGWVVAL